MLLTPSFIPIDYFGPTMMNQFHTIKGDYFLRSFFFDVFVVFQFGVVFLAICSILEPKSLICILFATYWN